MATEATATKTPAKKAPKVNVEKRRAEYEKFISTRDEEYDLWKDMSAQKAFFKEISTTTYDITDNFEPFFDKLFMLVGAFKIKTKLKELKYEYFRTFFFGGVGVRRDDSTDLEKTFDGLTRYVIKEDVDGALKARRAFLDIYMALDEINDLTEENFYDIKKKMKEALTAFCKFYEAHIKKHHKPIHEVLFDFHQVLRNVLTSNFYYSVFEFENQDPKQRKLNDFKDRALLDKVCVDMQEAFRILLMTNFIKDNPNLFVMTNKFKIAEWEQNRIQSYFIKPLYESWVGLRKEMGRLYVFGENHWVVPLGDNIEFVKLVNELIDRELICERLLGSDLKRDQLNFLFNTILYIYNSPAKDKLLSDNNEIVIENIIPKLTILRYLDHIVRITKAKRADILKQDRMQEYLTLFRQGKIDPNATAPEQAPVEETKQNLSIFLSKRDTKTPFITYEEEEDTPEDIDKYGRYWVWSDFFPDTMKDEIIKCAEMLRNINVAVRQDLADDYLTKPLKPHPNMHKGHAEKLKKKKEKLEPANATDKVRPPFLWNHTDIIEENHEYRPNAHPEEVYIDARVKEMNSHIETLAYELREFQKNRWQELVRRVIGFFKDHPEEKHSEILKVKLPQTF